MGMKQSIIANVCSFRQQEWDITQIITYTNIKDPYYGSNFQVYRHKLNASLQVQKYNLLFTTYNQYQTYKEIIDWRNSNRNLISSKYIKNISQQGICSDMHHCTIFIERIPIRLFQTGDIQLEEALNILYVSIQAFSILYDKFGYFKIEPQMICFTKEGYVKVWANKNLSKAYPQRNYQEKHKTYSQFIQCLFKLIEGLIDYQGRITISKFIQKKKIKLPFQDLLKVIEFYIKQNNVSIPRYLKSIRELCRKNKKPALSYRQSYENIATVKNRSNRTLIQTKTSDPMKANSIINESRFIKKSRTSFNEKQEQKVHLFMVNSNQNSPVHKRSSISFRYSDCNMNQTKRTFKTSFQDVPRKNKIYSDIIPQDYFKKIMQTERSPKVFSPFEKYQIDPEIAQDLIKLSQTVN